MNKNDVPESFGVFNPVNHVVIAFPSAASLDDAIHDFEGCGFEASSLAHYTPEEMIRQADAEIAKASPLAAIGQELNLVKAQRELALQGHSFLVVPIGDDKRIDEIRSIAERHGAARAQRYGRAMIEELIEPGDGLQQRRESWDSGLDAQTRTGREPHSERR
jgi:hypothetical protein